MKKLFLVLTVVSSLYGCATTTPGVPGDSTGASKSPVSGSELHTKKTTVDLDPTLLEKCSPLPENVLAKNVLPSQVLDAKIAETKLYYDCAARHSKLVDVVRDAFYIEH